MEGQYGAFYIQKIPGYLFVEGRSKVPHEQKPIEGLLCMKDLFLEVRQMASYKTFQVQKMQRSINVQKSKTYILFLDEPPTSRRPQEVLLGSDNFQRIFYAQTISGAHKISAVYKILINGYLCTKNHERAFYVKRTSRKPSLCEIPLEGILSKESLNNPLCAELICRVFNK